MNPTASGAILLGIMTLASGFFALARAALVNSHRPRLRRLAEQGVRGADWATRVADNSARLLVTVQFGQMLFSVLAAAFAGARFAPPLAQWFVQLSIAPALADGMALIIVTSLVAVLLLLAGDTLPEAIALRNPEGLALSLAWVVHSFGTLFAPIVRLAMRISQRVAGPGGGKDTGLALVTEEEIKTLVDAGEEEGIIEEDEKAMIFSIFEFGDTAAREVMVPRIDIVALEINTPLVEALKVIVEAGHSRIPVFAGNIDNIRGFLYAKDLLELSLLDVSGQPAREVVIVEQSLEGLLRPAHFVPESKTLDDLLADLQQRRVHIAIVVDEYGGTAGVVTIEDILEEIVGEIQDEYDSEEALFQVIGEHETIFDARIDLDDVNRMLGTNLPTEQGDTLGGFVYSQLGKVPVAGEVILFDGYVIEVMNVISRRIKNVRIRRQSVAEDASSDRG